MAAPDPEEPPSRDNEVAYDPNKRTVRHHPDRRLRDHSRHKSLMRIVNSDPEDIHNDKQLAADAGESLSLKVYDEMTYSADAVSSWQVLLMWNPYTIWNSRNLWKTLFHLLLLAISVAIVVVCSIPDPASLKINIFYELSKFLNVFCGLMLGFFLTSSVKRWHHCAQGFLELCDAIRNLQMQLQAMGVPKGRCDTCIRYGLLSGWLLMNHLESEMNNPGKKLPDEMWEDIECDVDKDKDTLEIQPQMVPEEIDIIREVSDPATAMWTWISSLLGRMAEDKQIPDMPTPTYGRIMNLVQEAHNGIRHVRSAIQIRVPFVYAQMLCTLVHVNNFMNAINLGVVLGIAISGAMIRKDAHFFYDKKVKGNQVERDVQFMLVTAFISCAGPMLFQALIEIAICLAQPFATKYGKIPIGRLLISLEEDLHDGEIMAQRLPKWERPMFNRPNPATV
jgi:predicted membrane chloride channel (bestrophin family)